MIFGKKMNSFDSLKSVSFLTFFTKNQVYGNAKRI
jgi:hypothetical protein